MFTQGYNTMTKMQKMSWAVKVLAKFSDSLIGESFSGAKFHIPSAKWQEIAAKLNSLGGPKKDAAKWEICFHDLK